MFEKEIISAVYEAAAGLLTKEEIAAALETPKESRLGDLALPCFKFSRSLRKAPPAIAGEIAAAIKLPECVERTELAGGYLNFFFDRVKAAAGLRGLDGWTGESTRGEREGEGKTICLDYSSVNIAKPINVRAAPVVSMLLRSRRVMSETRAPCTLMHRRPLSVDMRTR